MQAIATEESELCISGLVLQGLKKPNECSAFGVECTPQNPLGATMSALQMLESEMDTHQREIVEIGIQSLNRMQDLIDSLLNLEHIESGVGLKSDLIDVRDLIERGMIDIQTHIPVIHGTADPEYTRNGSNN